MKKNKRGIALAFALVLLSLMLVIGVSFIILSANERASSAAAANSSAARLLVSTAVNRAKISLLHEIVTRPSLDDTGASQWRPINEHFFSKTSEMEEKEIIKNSISKYEDIERLLLKGVTNKQYKGIDVQWNYITSPDFVGSQQFSTAKTKNEQRVIGRIAYLGFSSGKISLGATLDSAYQVANKPPRYGHTVREIRPEVTLDADGRQLISELAPQTSSYLKTGTNQTELWPDLETVAEKLNYRGTRNAPQIINLYETFAIGKLPSPEMWRMPAGVNAKGQPIKDIRGNKLKTYHRFNLHKTPEQWTDFDVEENIALDLDKYAWVKKDNTQNFNPPDEDVGLYYFSGLKYANLAQFKEIDIKHQLMANLKDYNDEDLKSTNDYERNGYDGISYAGLEKVPYITDVRLYYGLKPGTTGTGEGSTPVYFSLANVELEVTNEYLNPDLEMTEVRCDIRMDVEATVGSEVLRLNCTEQYKWDVSASNQSNLILPVPNEFKKRIDRRALSNTTGPYFLWRDNAENRIGDIQVVDKTVSGPLNFSKFTFKKLIFVIRGKGTYRGKTFPGKEATTEEKDKGIILSIHKTVEGKDQSFSGFGTLGESNKRFFALDQSDDPRCCLIAAGWDNDQEMAGHKGYMTVSIRKAEKQGDNTSTWGTAASINQGATNQVKAKYEDQHAQDQNGALAPCRDPELDVFNQFGNNNAHAAFFSSCYIRNAPMVSPWELGFIHRVRPWQTINLKRFNPDYQVTMDFSCDGYVRGDAAILDQVKVTSDNISYGKINLNTANKNVLKSLLADVKFSAKVWDAETDPGPYTSDQIPDDDPLNYQAEGPIPENDLERYAESLEKYIRDERGTNWYSRAWVANAFREGNIDIIKDLTRKDIIQARDVTSEELMGKIIPLLEAENAREVTVLAVAQVIQDGKNKEQKYGTYEPGVDRIVSEAKVMVILEYWPKLSPPPPGGENYEYLRSDWVIKKIIYLDPSQGGV